MTPLDTQQQKFHVATGIVGSRRDESNFVVGYCWDDPENLEVQVLAKLPCLACAR